jgi:BlaI family transcriptional regulator, penicillinase repressor
MSNEAIEPMPPVPVLPVLHALEAEVMSALWGLGEASVREVMDALNAAADRPRAYTTYMTILARLTRKGLLTRRRDARTDRYAPAYTRDRYAELRAAAEVAALVDAYGDLALSHFARHMAALDSPRRDALEQMARAR